MTLAQRRSCGGSYRRSWTSIALEFARLLSRIATVDLHGHSVLHEFAKDEMISSLLTLHGLHPTGFQTRAEQALERIMSGPQFQGLQLRLFDVCEENMRVELTPADGARSASEAVRQSVKIVLLDAVPDCAEIAFVGFESSAKSGGFIPLSNLTRNLPRRTLSSPAVGAGEVAETQHQRGSLNDV